MHSSIFVNIYIYNTCTTYCSTAMTRTFLLWLISLVFIILPQTGQSCHRNHFAARSRYLPNVYVAKLSGMARFSAKHVHRTNDSNNDVTITLVHGRAYKAVKKRQPLPYLPFLDPDVTILSTKEFPIDKRHRPTIGNGHVASVIKNDAIFMNGLYNGFNITSHRARIPSLLISGIKTNQEVLFRNASLTTKVSYKLDVGTGMFNETHSANGYTIELKQYAHRTIRQLLVTELVIKNNLNKPLELNLAVNQGKPSEDITFTKTLDGDVIIQNGITNDPEYESTGKLNVSVISTRVPDKITISPGQEQRHLYLVSIDSQLLEAQRAFDEGVSLFMNQTLENLHREGWSDIWKNGRIDMTGNKEWARITYAALYYILSSLPLEESPDFIGLSPGDLAHGILNEDYEGHVFWDQETWMYPPVQMLHTKMGKAIIKTRIRVLDAAKENALQNGYKGAMFPWESAVSGLNVCPGETYAKFEQHITGDIALAFRQYLMMTNDTRFLAVERGAEAIQEMAKFWASRAKYVSQSDSYEIWDVMPPDEWHPTVKNSAYTNAVARISLLLPKLALGLINRTADKHFEDIASKMYIPFDNSLQYHPEYDGYRKDIIVKQADVVLLGYPLMVDMKPEVRRNDLEYYRKVTPGGPAMTWGMFAVGYLELNDTDNADDMFKRQFKNVVPPFNIWTEETDGQGAVNFITGMGGYLQSLIFGYGGFRIFPDRLEFNGKLPDSVTVLNITGVDYLGGSLDFSFSETELKITQTKTALRILNVTLSLSEIPQTLQVGKALLFPTQKAYIVPLV